MAKFNIRNKISDVFGKRAVNHPDATLNFEGGLAFEMDPKSKLYSRVATALVGEPKFYRQVNFDGEINDDSDGVIVQEVHNVADNDPEFVLQLAAYARNVLNLRSISIVLLVEASLNDKCKPFVRAYTPAIVKRADELAETVAYLQRRIGDIGDGARRGSIPSSLKRGLADAFHNFDEYQFAKYNRKGYVKLKDVLRLVHPIPRNAAESALFKRIRNDTLKIPKTWEVEISAKGSDKKSWEKILPSMGYMAQLRNLRNFLQHGVDMRPVVSSLVNPNFVKNNKQLPFRYYAAYKMIQSIQSPYTSKTLDALENAMDVSVENLPKLKGTTLIVGDESRSMMQPLSRRSMITILDVCNIMLSIAHRICEFPMVGIFGDTFAIVNLSQRNGIISNMKEVQAKGPSVGYSTNAWTIMKYLIDNRIKVDRLILFSDMQCYNSTSYGNESLASMTKEYKRKINPNVFIYSIDLAGYGTMQIPKDEPRTCLIAGWSERILEFINIYEGKRKTAVDMIAKITPEEFKTADAIVRSIKKKLTTKKSVRTVKKSKRGGKR